MQCILRAIRNEDVADRFQDGKISLYCCQGSGGWEPWHVFSCVIPAPSDVLGLLVCWGS